MTDSADIVVGSGPAGVSAAMALLARGRPVVMVDGGRMLDAAAESRRAALARLQPGQWTTRQRADWQAPQFSPVPGQVRRYGSDFAQEQGTDTLSDAPWFGLRASRAMGGLSNVWGAAVLPHRASDIADWPVTEAEMDRHYRAVAAFLPISGTKDTLANLLPTYLTPDAPHIPPSPQAAEVLRRLSGQGQPGFHIGAARQAVSPGCTRCGMCLHGCPWGLIWSARQTLDRLRTDPNFTYLPGRIVTRFAESADGVTLTLTGGDTLTGARAYIGAGVLETARIVLNSAPEPGRELILRDSQHAFLPMLHRWRAPARPDRAASHTLPQLFAELDRPDISPHLIHAQIYTWNEFYARDLIASYGRKLPGLTPLWHALARRLIVAQLFLHSDHSHRIGLRLTADGRLAARLDENPAAAATLRAAQRALARGFARAGLTALTPAARPGAPGSSFHTGGTVPMSRTPGPGQSDPLGRPQGLSRIHLIDASTLPSIPATTITFGVMANAHRIGEKAI